MSGTTAPAAPAALELLRGHTTLITGASAGIGRGIALSCARAGAHVVVTARRQSAADAVVREIEKAGGSATGRVCDVSVPGDIENAIAQAVERFGAVDSLVHNATSARSPEPVALEDVDLGLWREHADVSLTGSYRCARAAYAELRRRRGSLLLMTSPAGIDGSPTLPLYSAVKGGQRGMVKGLAREWGPDGIRVNALCPQAATPALVRAFEKNPTLEEHLSQLTPLGWIGDPDLDVGNATVVLLSQYARYVTGQTWVVDGGRFLGL